MRRYGREIRFHPSPKLHRSKPRRLARRWCSKSREESERPSRESLVVQRIHSRRRQRRQRGRSREPERGEPIATVAQQIDKDQTYRYKEASGDFNPIHVDENFAKMAGLPGIIVHGLCTMAFTSKVMIDKLCGGDPVKLKRLRVRFTRPVFPDK